MVVIKIMMFIKVIMLLMVIVSNDIIRDGFVDVGMVEVILVLFYVFIIYNSIIKKINN